jgi:hypothetical protein
MQTQLTAQSAELVQCGDCHKLLNYLATGQPVANLGPGNHRLDLPYPRQPVSDDDGHLRRYR